ncbi:MAG: sugar phosphate isomerase/epimerase [Kiritimatiellae bacterium]|nr:sugar phosphate isomerase/epimerase [Kiritimatiellia bacterium]
MTGELKLCAGAWGFREIEIPAYLEACARLGFPYAEMNLGDNPAVKHLATLPDTGALSAMAEAEQASGVKVVCFCVGNDFTKPDQTKLGEDIARLKKQIDIAGDGGVEVIRVFAGFTPFESLNEDSYRRCADALAVVGQHGQDKGVLVALENHGGPTATGAQVRRLLEMANHPNVKANYDGGNFAHCREDPLSAYLVLRGRIGYTHWKDVRIVDGQLEYCALGDGVTDWAPVVRALIEDGYDGYWTMEYEEPSDVETGMRKCIDVVTQAAGVAAGAV